MPRPIPTPKKRKKKRWEAPFLAALAETGIVAAACRAVPVHKDTVFDWRRRSPDFARVWRRALSDAADKLEIEARRRAHDGLLRLIFHKGQPVIDPRTITPENPNGDPYYELEYSDTLLIFLLKGIRPGKYRERQEIRHKHSGRIGVNVTEVVVRNQQEAHELLSYLRETKGLPAQ